MLITNGPEVGAHTEHLLMALNRKLPDGYTLVIVAADPGKGMDIYMSGVPLVNDLKKFPKFAQGLSREMLRRSKNSDACFLGGRSSLWDKLRNRINSWRISRDRTA